MPRVDVRDAEGYKEFVAASKLAFDRFGAKFLRAAARMSFAEGAGRARNVIIEFESLAVAHDCYHSPEYQRAVAIRQRSPMARSCWSRESRKAGSQRLGHCVGKLQAPLRPAVGSKIEAGQAGADLELDEVDGVVGLDPEIDGKHIAQANGLHQPGGDGANLASATGWLSATATSSGSA